MPNSNKSHKFCKIIVQTGLVKELKTQSIELTIDAINFTTSLMMILLRIALLRKYAINIKFKEVIFKF